MISSINKEKLATKEKVVEGAKLAKIMVKGTKIG